MFVVCFITYLWVILRVLVKKNSDPKYQQDILVDLVKYQAPWSHLLWGDPGESRNHMNPRLSSCHFSWRGFLTEKESNKIVHTEKKKARILSF